MTIRPADVTAGEPRLVYQASNREQGLSFGFADDAIVVTPALPAPASWRLALAAQAWGRDGAIERLRAGAVRAEEAQVLYGYAGALDLRADNGARGLDLIFVAGAPPAVPPAAVPTPLPVTRADEPPLVLDIQIEGDLAAAATDDRPGALLIAENLGPVLRLSLLCAFDAAGRELPAKIQIVGGGQARRELLRVVVDDAGASFPIGISLRLASIGSSKLRPKGDEGAARTDPTAQAVGSAASAADASAADAPVAGAPVANAPAFDAPAADAPAPLAAPSNDTCAGAIDISNAALPALSSPVDIADATTAGDPATCVTVDRTVWYRFTAPATGTYSVTTCWSGGAIGTSLPDTVLAVYEAGGGCAALGALASCNDDDTACAPGTPGKPGVTSGKQSSVLLSLTAGAQYFIVVGRYAGVGAPAIIAGLTSVQVRVVRSAPPANDSCSGLPPALGLDFPVGGSTQFATNDYQLSTTFPSCYTLPGPPQPIGQTVSAAPGRDVVYTFTAPSAGRYSFRITGYAASQNPILYVSTSCPSGVPPVTISSPPCVGAANRNTTQGAEEVMWVNLAAGQQVFVFVDDASATNAGSLFRLEVNRTVRETEQNGTTATADDAACPLTGSINPAGDVDFYSLGAPGAGQRVFAVSDGVAAGDTDQQLRVTTAADTLEFDDDNNFAPFGSLSPNLAGTALTAAAAYLRLNNLTASTTAEPYRLYQVIAPSSASAGVETEPNGTASTASSAGNNYFSGSLGGPAPSTDVDVYRFAARAGTLILLNLDGDPLRDGTPVDAGLELLDSAGETLLYVNDTGSSGNTSSTAPGTGSLTAVTPYSPAEAIVFRAPSSGSYYARVSIGTTSTNAYGAGDYLLSIGLNCLPGDADADGVADAADCAPSDAGAWASPGEARSLAILGRGPTSLAWSAPADPGSATVVYDALCSTSPSDFSAARAICLASGISGTSAVDSDPRPPAGTMHAYLVRSRNACGGNLGTTSAGMPRTGRSCP